MKTTLLLAAVCTAALGRADVPPAPGPESWTFKEDLARPVRYHAPEAYRVDDQYGLSGDMETVAADLARFMSSAKSQSAKTLTLRRGEVDGHESYRVSVASGGDVTLTAGDDDGMRRAVAYFEDRAMAGDLAETVRRPWLRHRISRCYFSPIKRPPFNRDELADDVDYYPDEYLNRLSHEGVNGLWLSIKFRELVGTFLTERPEGASARIEKLRRTVVKCRRYGIRVWAFGIEPQYLTKDDEFAKAHPDILSGIQGDESIRVICPSTEDGIRYVRECAEGLFKAVPGLAGILNISHGERPTTCLSQISPLSDKRAICRRCAALEPWRMHKLIAEAMVAGMRRGNPDAEFLSWFYQPHVRWERADWVPEIAAHLPDGVTMIYNFESGALKDQLGRYRPGGDYWLSYVGPAPAFSRVAESAREAGGRIGAKIQVGCSHECATVPFVPVPGLLYRKYAAMKKARCTSVMQCWYFGNYPGVMNKAAGELAFEDFSSGEKSFLRRLARPEWGDSADEVAEIWKRLSDAYANYPMSNDMQYYGPFHAGVAWPLSPDVNLAPLGRTWKPHDPPSGDAIGECLENHTLDEACVLAERMATGADCRASLDRLAAKFSQDGERMRDLDVMRALGLLFRSGADILEFYRLRAEAVVASRIRGDAPAARKAVAGMRGLLLRERAVSGAMLPLARADSRLGFHSEAESHQFFPAKLEWRQAELDRAVALLDGIDADLKAGKGYPLSRHERDAAAFRLGEWTSPGRRFLPASEKGSQHDAQAGSRWVAAPGQFRFKGDFKDNGDFVLQGEVRDGACNSVTVRTMDVCGTSWPKTITVGKNGTAFSPAFNVVTASHEVRTVETSAIPGGWKFTLVLDARGWGGGEARRPGWIAFWRQGSAPVWPEVDPAPEWRLNIGNWTPACLGRIVGK